MISRRDWIRMVHSYYSLTHKEGLVLESIMGIANIEGSSKTISNYISSLRRKGALLRSQPSDMYYMKTVEIDKIREDI